MTVETAAGRSLWQGIRDALSREVAVGRYAPGTKLPTEAALARRFGVNRHTVRRALAAFSEAGQIHVRRGAGAFVTPPRLDYAIGPRTRFSQNLTATGHTPARQILRIETVNAERPGAMIACHLRMSETSPVLRSDSLDTDADGQPICYGISWFCSERVQLVVDRSSFP